MQIGALAQASGLTPKTIRFYEQRGLLAAPPRTAGGYRDYPEQALGRLRFVRDAQAAGLTLAELRSILVIRDEGNAPCEHVATVIEDHLRKIEQRLVDLRKTRTVLQSLARRAAVADPSSCAEEDICTILKDPEWSEAPPGDTGDRGSEQYR